MIDGVPVYFPSPARDSRPGLDIETAGCVTLDGRQALGLRAVPPLPALRGRPVAHRPLRRPRSHQPPAGLHHPRAAPCRRPGRAQPAHPRSAGRCRARHGHRRRPPHRRRHHHARAGPSGASTPARSSPTRCPTRQRLGGWRVDPAPAGRGGPADPRPLPRHRPRRPAAGGRARAGAQRLRASPVTPGETSDGARRGRVQRRRHRRGGEVRPHRTGRAVHGRATRRRPSWWPATSSRPPGSSWSRSRSRPTSSWSPARCSPACAPTRGRPLPSTTATTTTTTIGTSTTTASTPRRTSTTSTTVVGYVPQAPEGVDC